METLKTINNRKSVRKYTGALTEGALKTVLLAGEASPIGMGKYGDMHMTVIREREILDGIERAANEFFKTINGKPLYGAPCLILVSTKLSGTPMDKIPYSNAAIVAENMHLAATDIGLGSCLIWGAINGLNNDQGLIKKLNLPEGHTPCCGVIVGETEEKFTDRIIPEGRISISYIK